MHREVVASQERSSLGMAARPPLQHGPRPARACNACLRCSRRRRRPPASPVCWNSQRAIFSTLYCVQLSSVRKAASVCGQGGASEQGAVGTGQRPASARKRGACCKPNGWNA